MRRSYLFFALVALCLGSGAVSAQQLTYTPLNPAFGGNTFNYSWLLSSASAQNGLQQSGNVAESESELDLFGQSLNRQILGQISRTLLDQQIESIGDLTEEGSFTLGDLVVEVFETGEGLTINIFDTTNGEQTQVVVPN